MTSQNITIFINKLFRNNSTPLTYFSEDNTADLEKGLASPFSYSNQIPEMNFTSDFNVQNFNNFKLTPPQTDVKNSDHVRFISPATLASIIKSRNNKKSAGFDLVSNFILKKLSKSFINHLCVIFNQIYNTYWLLSHSLEVSENNPDS